MVEWCSARMSGLKVIPIPASASLAASAFSRGIPARRSTCSLLLPVAFLWVGLLRGHSFILLFMWVMCRTCSGCGVFPRAPVCLAILQTYGPIPPVVLPQQHPVLLTGQTLWVPVVLPQQHPVLLTGQTLWVPLIRRSRSDVRCENLVSHAPRFAGLAGQQGRAGLR